MKRLIWTVLFVFGLSGLVIPTVYFLAAARLPSLDSEFDVERELKLIIEGERYAAKAGRIDAETIDTTFQRPDFTTLPKEMVAMFITDLGCPTYFQTPREEGPQWAWRVIAGTFLNKELAGDGRCELLLTRRLAQRLGIKPGGLEMGVAAHKLHAFMQKDQLVAWDLETMTFARGVTGVRDASRALFRQDVEQLSLGQLAELTLALPSNGVYVNLVRCQNPARLREWRNSVINQVASASLIAPDRALEAREEKISCVTP